AEAVAGEVVEGAGDVFDDDAAPCAQKLRADPGVIAEGRPPGAREARAHAALEVEQTHREVFDFGGVRGELPPLAEAASNGALDARRSERPERRVDEVDAEVHQAPAAGQRGIRRPGLLRTIRVVEHELDRVDRAELPRGEELTRHRQRARVPIAEVDPEQPIDRARGREHPFDLPRRRRERLLAEDRVPPLEGVDALARVQAARGRDDDAVEGELEQLLVVLEDSCVGHDLASARARLRVRVADGDDGCGPARRERSEAREPDPPDTETPEPREGRHGITNALTKPSGRSAVASSAAPSSSSE